DEALLARREIAEMDAMIAAAECDEVPLRRERDAIRSGVLRPRYFADDCFLAAVPEFKIAVVGSPRQVFAVGRAHRAAPVSGFMPTNERASPSVPEFEPLAGAHGRQRFAVRSKREVAEGLITPARLHCEAFFARLDIEVEQFAVRGRVDECLA